MREKGIEKLRDKGCGYRVEGRIETLKQSAIGSKLLFKQVF
jgi:biotin operon repressor